MSILWDHQEVPVLKYLPEVYLVPYAIKRNNKSPFVIKVQDSSEEVSDPTTDMNVTFMQTDEQSGKWQIQSSTKDPQSIDSTMDYSQFVSKQEFKGHLMERNLSFLKTKSHIKEPAKKRKK